MNEHTSGQLRRAALFAAVAGIAALTAACGGGGSPTAAGSASGQAPRQQALAYAQCMRSHGEPRFPDPDSQGHFMLTGPEVGPLNAPPYLSANKACEHLLPKSAPISAAQRRENVSQALEYTACMRAHGITDFPDPIIDEGGQNVGFRLGGIDQNAPQIRAAQQACRKFEPGLSRAVTGGVG